MIKQGNAGLSRILQKLFEIEININLMKEANELNDSEYEHIMYSIKTIRETLKNEVK